MNEINVPLGEMINDIRNKRGMSKIEEIKHRDFYSKETYDYFIDTNGS